MKIAIVDDDAQDTNRLAAFLAEWSEEHHLDFSVTVFHKSSDFLKAFETARYSLVFMDIYMGPPSGIETAMKLREKDSHALLIFLTSSPEHMSDAFRCHAFDYLVKPFDLEQMKKTILDALAFLPEKEQYLNLSVRKQNVPIFLLRYPLCSGQLQLLHGLYKGRIPLPYVLFPASETPGK